MRSKDSLLRCPNCSEPNAIGNIVKHILDFHNGYQPPKWICSSQCDFQTPDHCSIVTHCLLSGHPVAGVGREPEAPFLHHMAALQLSLHHFTNDVAVQTDSCQDEGMGVGNFFCDSSQYEQIEQFETMVLKTGLDGTQAEPEYENAEETVEWIGQEQNSEEEEPPERATRQQADIPGLFTITNEKPMISAGISPWIEQHTQQSGTGSKRLRQVKHQDDSESSNSVTKGILTKSVAHDPNLEISLPPFSRNDLIRLDKNTCGQQVYQNVKTDMAKDPGLSLRALCTADDIECAKCSKTFRHRKQSETMANVTGHVLTVAHGWTKQHGPWQCPQCPRRGARLRDVMAHSHRAHHNTLYTRSPMEYFKPNVDIQDYLAEIHASFPLEKFDIREQVIDYFAKLHIDIDI